MNDMDINEALTLVENIPYIPWIDLTLEERKAIEIVTNYVKEILIKKAAEN